MWKPIAADSADRDSIQNKIEKLFNSLSNEIAGEERIGLLDGYSGLLLFFAYYASYKKNAEVCDEQIGACFEKLSNNISNSSQSVLVSNGLSGVMWSLNHLYDQGFIDVDDSFLDVDVICEISFNYFDTRDNKGPFSCLDYLHGITGITCALSGTRTFKKDKYIGRFLAILNKLRPAADAVYWESMLHNMTGSETVISLGLAHGNTSIAVTLAKLLKSCENEAEKKEISTLLNGLITFIQSRKFNAPAKAGNWYPAYILAKDNSPAGDRLAWCYGDLSIAVCFYRVGTLTGRQDLIDEAVELFVHSSSRRNIQEVGVNDAAFCHGALGLAHIFNRFYQYTSREELKDAALYWLRQGLDMFDDSDPGTGLRAFNPGYGYGEITTSLLDGTIGITLILMSMISDQEPGWDEIFLLSGRN
jgi:lantibiotic modifying enzyme